MRPVAVAAFAALLGACGPTGVSAPAAPTPSSLPTPSNWSPTVAPLPLVSPTPAVSATPTASTSRPAASGPLRLGDAGAEVLDWQQTLAEHAYWLGKPDGTFGVLTQQATFAVQKVAGLARDGVVGPSTRAALARGQLPIPRTTVGPALEIDIARQVLLVVDGGEVKAVLNTSTGSGALYRSGRRWARAVTPRGSFSVLREVNDLRISPLGFL